MDPRVAGREPRPGDHIVVEERDHFTGRCFDAGLAGCALATVLSPHRAEPWLFLGKLCERLV